MQRLIAAFRGGFAKHARREVEPLQVAIAAFGQHRPGETGATAGVENPSLRPDEAGEGIDGLLRAAVVAHVGFVGCGPVIVTLRQFGIGLGGENGVNFGGHAAFSFRPSKV